MLHKLNPGKHFKSEDIIFSIDVQPYSTKELCNILRVSRKTLYCWLKLVKHQIGKKNGRMYTVVQVQIMFAEFGVPFKLVERD